MSDVPAVFAQAWAVDPGLLDQSGLAVLVAQLGVVDGWSAAVRVLAARRADVLHAERQAAQGADGQNTFGFGGNGRDRFEPAVDLLTDDGRCSVKTAQAVTDREKICVLFPLFEQALGAGVVSTGHVDALVHAMRNLSEMVRAEFVTHQDDLLCGAQRERVEMFGSTCRDLARFLTAKADALSDADELERQTARSSIRRWVDKATGMHKTHIELDPVRDEIMWGVIDAQMAMLRQVDGNRTVPYQQLQVDALIATITSGAGHKGGRRAELRVPEISVLIDNATLLNGLHERSICETQAGIPLPVSRVREMCCDANIIPIVLGGANEVLDLGRASRTANKPQRLALRVEHRTCAKPNCEVSFNNCRIHHIAWWWEHLGETNLDNLIPICEKHHHQLHQGLWALAPNAKQTWAKPTPTRMRC